MATDTTALDTLAEHFREQLGERVLDAQVAYDQLTLTVAPDALPQVARFCKHEMGMSFFDFLTAVDDRENGFSLVVRVYSHIKRQAVILRVAVPGGRDAPRIATLTGVYAGANWHERETYDMFGIVFEGHPGLLPRILTVENFEGWPLRKEFRLATRDVKPWPGAKEPGGADEEGGSAPAVAAPAPGADPGDRAAAAKAKAERAKAKAAEARARKAAEKAAAMEGQPEEGAGDVVAPPEAAEGTATPEPTPDDAESGSAREAMPAAAGKDVQAGTPDPSEPEGAAEIAGTAVAKDAAAGVADGDTATLAPGDPEGEDAAEPVRDPRREAAMAEGGDPAQQSAPGVQLEGTHDLETSTARTADVSDEPQLPEPADEEPEDASEEEHDDE